MDGFIYCFSTANAPGMVKVGMTTRSPLDRLKEANHAFGPGQKWRIDFAKKVYNVRIKETYLHQILAPHRIEGYPKEQFKISVHEVSQLVHLMDGEWWVDAPRRHVEPNEPLNGHLYHGSHRHVRAIIHGLNIPLTTEGRRMFPPCRQPECTCFELKMIPWRQHVIDVDTECRRLHNLKFPVPRRRIGHRI
jgi:hypothetical protein